MLRVFLLLLVVGLTTPVRAESAADQLAAIQGLGLDPQQCFRVRDVFLEREDVKLYFIDGYLVFAEPLNGRTLAAMFIAVAPTDEGEILLIPPNARERQSLVRFTSQPVLNEKFRTAMMFFTDDTGDALRKAIKASDLSRPDPAVGRDLARKWTRPVGNVLAGLSLRMLFDTFSSAPAEDGFFAAALGGGARGRFDVVIDPRHREQVVLGQTVWREGRRFYEMWCRFQGLSFRSGRRPVIPRRGHLDNYNIETHLLPDLSMQVTASADLLTENASEQMYAFELSERLRLQEVLVDGEPAEFIQFRQSASIHTASRNNDLLAVVLPAPTAGDERRRIEFRYQGTVVRDAGNGVYYVGSRSSWYPRRENPFASFELTFHYPETLDLVATGELVGTEVSDGVRTSKFRTDSPIRLAGFNLGKYERAHRDVGEYRVEVCANKTLEENLQPRPGPPIIWSPTRPGLRRRGGSQGVRGAIIAAAPRPVLPSPVRRLDYVASDSAEAFAYFLEKFGPPSTRTIVISPIPGTLGQGLPGLVYASTLSYFRPDDPPLKNRSPEEQLFYSELLRTHEISHQWWGNVIGADVGPDEWIMEALATYSSLLFLEKRHGRAALDRALGSYKTHLLARNDNGETNESAGAIVLGDRLRSSLAPEAARIIVYEKGAWIIHMLRGVMGDQNFFSFLRSLCEKFRFRSLTTEELRTQTARFVEGDSADSELNAFFEQWVYGTGIPTVRIVYDVKRAGNGFEVTGRMHQEGVPESFSARIPLGVHGAQGVASQQYVTTYGRVTEFRFSLKDKPARISIDPANFMLVNR